ncbi:MAG: radical SAM protein [Desulfatiglandaceae bacterium]
MTPEVSYSWRQVKSWDLKELLDKARRLSWRIHGKEVQYFIPGRMVYMGERGKYPAISLTGTSCALNCDHCYRKILEGMIPATEPDILREICQRLDEEGNLGVLLSGGSDRRGTLPWKKFAEAIQWIKHHTRLKISVHTGVVDPETALALKDSGIDELLMDVVGSEETMGRVYHLRHGLKAMQSSLELLAATGIPLIPHIVVGLHYGKIHGEMHALEMVARYPISTLVIVVLDPIRETPMEGVRPPEPETVGRFVGAARLRIPHVPIALSCARPAGQHRAETDMLALEAGINRIAMPAEGAVEKAREMGLDVAFYKTCCSKSF